MKKIGMAGKSGLLAVSVFVAAVIFVACQSAPPQISIEGAQAELSPAIVGEAMVTMTIKNQGGSDALTGVSTDIPGAKASFHIMQGEHMASVARVKIPAKSNVEFKMGGSHIMIMDMPKTAVEGSQFNVTLTFEKSGEKQVPLTLRGASSMPGMPMGHEHHM
ncbi:MAG TPA: copper chaperone PCu(A)C [Nitrospirota bacterium]|nr:copper chaperone PCu(A)C [Nitrospirota bacterium]